MARDTKARQRPQNANMRRPPHPGRRKDPPNEPGALTEKWSLIERACFAKSE